MTTSSSTTACRRPQHPVLERLRQVAGEVAVAPATAISTSADQNSARARAHARDAEFVHSAPGAGVSGRPV
jgi:tRNA A37 threonylcarbamoyladenosine synthetase subunit TsaC/SUA5/YrdC